MQIRLVLVALAALVAGAGAAVLTLRGGGSEIARTQNEGVASIGGAFKLIDQNGREVTDADFRGKFMLVFFGYTYCPDICPSELQVMTSALNALGAQADQIAPIFITIDPDRDTQAQLSSYVKSFHPNLIALTGTPEAVEGAVKAYRVYASRVADASSAADYLMDHSAFIYLMGPDGRYLTHFTYGVAPEKMAEGLRKQLSSFR